MFVKIISRSILTILWDQARIEFGIAVRHISFYITKLFTYINHVSLDLFSRIQILNKAGYYLSLLPLHEFFLQNFLLKLGVIHGTGLTERLVFDGICVSTESKLMLIQCLNHLCSFCSVTLLLIWLAAYSRYTASFLDLTCSYTTQFCDITDQILFHLILVTAPKCGYSSAVGM